MTRTRQGRTHFVYAASTRRTGSTMLAVRDEDLVDDPALIETTRRFAGVRIQGTGLLGRTSSFNRERHGHEAGTSRCGLWQDEADGEGLANALAFRDLVPEYAEFQASIPGAGRVGD